MIYLSGWWKEILHILKDIMKNTFANNECLLRTNFIQVKWIWSHLSIPLNNQISLTYCGTDHVQIVKMAKAYYQH